MEKAMMVGKVELEIATLTGLNISEFKNKFNEWNIMDAELVVTLSDGTKATLPVGELFSMNFQAFEPDTGIEIVEENEISY